MGIIIGIMKNLPDAIGLGLIWGIMTLGVFITFRILDLPDMTVDGSFAMGGCISGSMIAAGVNPALSILIAVLGGMAAGLVTGILHTKLKIPGILAGILTMFGLYSVNLHILGRPNVGIPKFVRNAAGENVPVTTVINFIKDTFNVDRTMSAIIAGMAIVVVVIAVMYWFFGTELGCCLRATGSNEYMVRALGTSTDAMKILGLVIANALVALGGAVYTQYQGYSDVNMGQGAIVTGLAAIVIGEVLFGHRLSFFVRLISVVCGSVIYRIVYAVVLKLGMSSDDMKLLTACIVAIALSVPVIREKINTSIRLRKNSVAYKEVK